ncbi:hypothetical protein [Bacillus sp. MUM 13]|uniref:hypothetical protein n=1 Tax=Bacillus sp. MUM 13 TaxID=1678001 RepID=UPI0008F59A8B|nr:hypothetical protein [Bacillus sp. MUM 13]OIK07426.1 hypothetical protein BIV59_21080 [Bacillus sp. MUM 13]
MTRKVLTYQAPAQLYRSDSLFFREYADCLHIVATNSLKTGLGESMKMGRWITAPIITFSELFTELAGVNWSSSKAQLKQFLTLSDIISELWRENPGGNRLVVQSIERNQLQVLKTLRMVTELGMSPTDLQGRKGQLTASETVFLEMWNRMLSLLQRNSKDLRFFLEGTNYVTNTMMMALNNWGAEQLTKKKKGAARTMLLHKRRISNLLEENWRHSIQKSLAKKILILHGFYFITPIQERVFKRLEDEFDLVFLNAYDSRFPNTFETVKTFLGIEENETCNVVDDYVAIHPLAARLVESLEGGSQIEVDQKVEVYNDLGHFVEYEKERYVSTTGDGNEIDEPYHILTPRAGDIEKLLIANEFIEPSKKKLTDYPIGRFLYRLHQMKSRETDLENGTEYFTEVVTAEALLDCFSSGCLIFNGEDLRRYVKTLEKVIPYCKKAKNFDTWIAKINDLIKEKESMEKKTQKTNKHALSSRAHLFHSMPMRQISYFSVATKDLEKINEGIRILKGMNDALFGDWVTKKSISSHFKTLEEMVLKNVEDFFEDGEKEIVTNLVEEIADLKDEELEFSLKDISKGLLFFLDGSLHEAGETESVSDKVFAFDQADGAPFRVNRKFHLAFADHKALPIPQGYTLWPISSETLAQLQESNPELHLFEERKKQSNSITRYLLYVLFHSSDDVRFSYAKHVGNESRLELALYLKLLNCKTVQMGRVTKEIDAVKKDINEKIDVKDAGWTLSMEREAKVCGKRASFSFILNEHTSFQSDFHHGFLYQNLVGTLQNLVGSNVIAPKELRNVVDSWFPQWNDMKRDFLYESAYKNRNPKRELIKLNGQKYSQAISYLHLLPTSYAHRPGSEVEKEEVILHKANPGKHCRYCPFLSICNDGIYAKDFEDEPKASSENGTKKGQITQNTTQMKTPKRRLKATRLKSSKKDPNFSLETYLKSKKLEFIDKRSNKGCLWVVGGRELEPIFNELKTKNIYFRFAPNGGKATKRKKAWFLIE